MVQVTLPNIRTEDTPQSIKDIGNPMLTALYKLATAPGLELLPIPVAMTRLQLARDLKNFTMSLKEWDPILGSSSARKLTPQGSKLFRELMKGTPKRLSDFLRRIETASDFPSSVTYPTERQITLSTKEPDALLALRHELRHIMQELGKYDVPTIDYPLSVSRKSVAKPLPKSAREFFQRVGKTFRTIRQGLSFEGEHLLSPSEIDAQLWSKGMTGGKKLTGTIRDAERASRKYLKQIEEGVTALTPSEEVFKSLEQPLRSAMTEKYGEHGFRQVKPRIDYFTKLAEKLSGGRMKPIGGK